VEGLRIRDKDQVSARMKEHLRQAIENVKIVFSQEQVGHDTVAAEKETQEHTDG